MSECQMSNAKVLSAEKTTVEDDKMAERWVKTGCNQKQSICEKLEVASICVSHIKVEIGRIQLRVDAQNAN